MAVQLPLQRSHGALRMRVIERFPVFVFRAFDTGKSPALQRACQNDGWSFRRE
jgi:hypothetical protein